MADALAALQALSARLGRPATLEELLTHLGPGPSGTPTPQFSSPPGSEGMASDEEMSAMVLSQDLMAQNPQIARRREELLYDLLFGISDRRFLLGIHEGAPAGNVPAPGPTYPKPVKRSGPPTVLNNPVVAPSRVRGGHIRL